MVDKTEMTSSKSAQRTILGLFSKVLNILFLFLLVKIKFNCKELIFNFYIKLQHPTSL